MDKDIFVQELFCNNCNKDEDHILYEETVFCIACETHHPIWDSENNDMPTYRKKPVIVQAFEFTGKLNQDVPEWFRNAELQNIATRFFSNDGVTEGACHIKTLEGELIANIGDFIIKGVAGELYPCKPNIFEQTYEQVT